MALSVTQPTTRVVRNYRHDLENAMNLIAGVMMDLQNRAASDTVHRFVADVPWRLAADEVVEELKPLVTSLAITLAPSPDAPLNQLHNDRTRP